MSAGLFGKLPAKRDFVATNAPRQFLEVWEPWLQASVATSKQMLGGAWSEAYNRAPIWRFWLGADFCGEATIGVFMPSIDGVGRFFPLAIFVGEEGASLAPPELEPNDQWFDAAEAILLESLEPGVTLEQVAGRIAAMGAPVRQSRSSEIAGLRELPDGGVLMRDFSRQTFSAFLIARRFGHRRTFASQSFWWTIGGEGFPPLALSYVGLPPAARFADMLTGVFADTQDSGGRDAT